VVKPSVIFFFFALGWNLSARGSQINDPVVFFSAADHPVVSEMSEYVYEAWLVACFSSFFGECADDQNPQKKKTTPNWPKNT
jgi:hypothetical protein